jgi:hypothetical protein
MFKEMAKKNLLEIESIRKVLSFLDENDEEISCIKYNKCLTLVPQSRRKFSEVFQHWQPQVVMETIEKLPEPSQKKQKVVEKVESVCFTVDVNEEIFPPTIPEEPKVQEGGISENDWAQCEIDSSEIIETESGVEWVCKYCEPGPISFIDPEDFRVHLLTTHLSYEHIIDYPEGEEMIVEEDYESENVEQFDEFEDKPTVPEVKTEVILRSPEPKRQKLTPLKYTKSRFERLVCIDCNYQFSSQAHYQAHLNGHQLYEIVARHSQFPLCSICNTMFSDESFADSHMQKHENGEDFHEAMPCEGSFLKLGQYRSESDDKSMEQHGAFSCGHCLRQFPDEESCRLHQLIFHVQVLKCPIEHRVFKGNQAFTIHLKNNHPELFGDDAKFLCSVCKAEFSTLFDKLKHMKTCDMKKYACNHCDKKFSQKCYLTNHLRLVSGQSSVVCEICEKICRDKGDYQIHQR